MKRSTFSLPGKGLSSSGIWGLFQNHYLSFTKRQNMSHILSEPGHSSSRDTKYKKKEREKGQTD